MTAISIRPATAEDVPALIQLRMANAERHAALAPSSHRLQDIAAVTRYFTARFSGPLAQDAEHAAGGPGRVEAFTFSR